MNSSVRRPYWHLVLALSLSLNLMLLWHLRAQRAASPAVTEPGAILSGPLATRPEASPEPMPPAPAAVDGRWDDFFDPDLRTLRKRLLQAGCPEHAIKAILQVEVHQRYRPKLAELFRQMMGDYWEQSVVAKTRRKAPKTPEQVQAAQAFDAARREQDSLLQELLGPDWERRGSRQPKDRDEIDPRLAFLSEDRRQRLADQQQAVSELRQSLRSQGVPEAEADRQVNDLQAQQALERSQLFSPEEEAEYGARFSPFNHVAQNLYGFKPSSQERQAIVRLHETYDGKVPDAELRQALGDERFVQFRRASDRASEAIYRVANHLGLPEERMVSVYEVRQSAEVLAKTIRARRDLSSEQRSGLLQTLHRETLAALAGQFGEAGRDLYLRNGGGWVGQLTAATP